MKEIKFKGLTVKAPDEVAEILNDEETSMDTATQETFMKAEEVESFLKELIEWLESGKGACLKKSKELQMQKQMVSGVSPWETTPTVPSGARVSNVGAVSGIVAAPNLPSWLTGTPQGVAAASQLTVANMAEAFVNAVMTVINNAINDIANMMASFASTQARIYHELANNIGEKLEATMEKQEKIVEELQNIADTLKEVAPAGEGEEEMLLPEEPMAVSTSLPPIAPEEIGGAEGGAPGESVPPVPPGGAAGEETPPSPPPPSELEEEEERPMATQRQAPATPGGVGGGIAFSPQFLSALSQQLSKATREILETYSRSPKQEERPVPPSQSAFDIAESISSSLRKAGKKVTTEVEEDLTEPVRTAKPPEKGSSVASQLKGAPEGDTVRKQREEAKRQRKQD